MREIFVILHDIRSIHNVASIFRTADGAGANKIFLTGHSPTPIDRFGREVDAFTKVSLGAEKTIPWEQKEIHELIRELKQSGIQIVAVEQMPQSVNYKEFEPFDRVAFIFGNEVDGISEDVLKDVDSIIEIPMLGEKESLNVSVSAGIILYEYVKN